MKILIAMAYVLKIRNTYPSPFSSAISEAIRDTFKEMGYRFDENDNKKKGGAKPGGRSLVDAKSNHRQ